MSFLTCPEQIRELTEGIVWGASIENAELGYAVAKAAKVTIWQSLWGECRESLSEEYRGGGLSG